MITAIVGNQVVQMGEANVKILTSQIQVYLQNFIQQLIFLFWVD